MFDKLVVMGLWGHVAAPGKRFAERRALLYTEVVMVQ